MSPEKTKLCPECGSEYYAHISACADCGVPLQMPEEIGKRGIINLTLPRISTTNGSQSGKKRKKVSGSYRIYFRETAFLPKLHWLLVAVRESVDAGIFF